MAERSITLNVLLVGFPSLLVRLLHAFALSRAATEEEEEEKSHSQPRSVDGV